MFDIDFINNYEAETHRQSERIYEESSLLDLLLGARITTGNYKKKEHKNISYGFKEGM